MISVTDESLRTKGKGRCLTFLSGGRSRLFFNVYRLFRNCVQRIQREVEIVFGVSICRGQHLCKPDYSTGPALTRDLVDLFLEDVGERSFRCLY